MKKISISSLLKTAFALAIVAYLPLKANAWGPTGHRVVGQIAENHLSKKALKGVRDILGNESMAMASNWADFVKSDTAYKYLYNWHFVNLPEGLDKQSLFTFLDKYPEPNVYSKISEMAAILKNGKSTADQKLLAMRMLIHMVGDLNQPMHTARKEDLGGNRIYVTWFGAKSNLHKVWDEDLIDFQQLSYTEYANAIDHPTTDQLSLWKSSSLKDFVYGSYEACNKIYAGVKPDDKLGFKYNYDYVSLVNAQLLKGGICLANIINEIYN